MHSDTAMSQKQSLQRKRAGEYLQAKASKARRHLPVLLSASYLYDIGRHSHTSVSLFPPLASNSWGFCEHWMAYCLFFLLL